jgi:hypothetical protein
MKIPHAPGPVSSSPCDRCLCPVCANIGNCPVHRDTIVRFAQPSMAGMPPTPGNRCTVMCPSGNHKTPIVARLDVHRGGKDALPALQAAGSGAIASRPAERSSVPAGVNAIQNGRLMKALTSTRAVREDSVVRQVGTDRPHAGTDFLGGFVLSRPLVGPRAFSLSGGDS